VPQAAKSASRFVHRALAAIPSLVSRFMVVARPAKKKSKGDAGSASHSEITSAFLSTTDKAEGALEDGADFGSMFLAPPMAPSPKPAKLSRRRLRARFRARNFLKPPWMR
jgi:hypothetical protein